jgi:hypothetical protein
MLVLTFAALVGCSEYDLTKSTDRGGIGDEDDTGGGPDQDTDEGNNDTDEDGRCDEPDLGAGSVLVDDSCEAGPPVGTFTPVLEWSNTTVGDAYTTPVVGQLTDDDGDGRITSADMPDIVVGNSSGVYYAVSGDGGAVHWSTPNLGSEPMTAAIGDLDDDGWPEVVVSGINGTMAVRGSDGSAYWRGAAISTAYCGGVAIGDLNADGSPEVVIGSTILDGQTGATLGVGRQGTGTGYNGGGAVSIGVIADIDVDGIQEVVVGNALYKRDGTTKWSTREPDGFVAVADFDGDPAGEIVVSGGGRVRLQDDDGTLLWSGSYTGATSGPPTVADFDGDGEPEIGVAGNNTYVVLEADGSRKWTRNTNDASSGFTGSSVFDFEGDGQAEVVYADENDVFVYDGATGAVKMQEARHSSATCSEYPAVADVDNDGHAEIIYTSSAYSGGERGVTVIGDADDSWMPARSVWNQHAYNIVNVNDDGSIPAVPAVNWATYNSFRSGDLSAATGGVAADVVPVLSDICNIECDDGLLRVVVTVGNSGTVEVPAGVPISAYAMQGSTATWLATEYTADAIASGSTSRGLVFRLDPAAVGTGTLEFRADDADGSGTLLECYEDNNVLPVDDGLCP